MIQKQFQEKFLICACEKKKTKTIGRKKNYKKFGDTEI